VAQSSSQPKVKTQLLTKEFEVLVDLENRSLLIVKLLEIEAEIEVGIHVAYNGCPGDLLQFSIVG
jgi:hypothetical protein